MVDIFFLVLQLPFYSSFHLFRGSVDFESKDIFGFGGVFNFGLLYFCLERVKGFLVADAKGGSGKLKGGDGPGAGRGRGGVGVAREVPGPEVA